ncbi:SNF2 family ATP-dependent chromatin-remodeling factor snf21 [Gaeumannomyces tritici R3-111a-1]|uniref:SNF2 family ATP-dependent chromatin-remodeling factor snf21 n=1 Tax=Gaeumannomyces tritici (strain R3-111a-1) TaxID=644352 RepID=J3P7G2_GAET3|nr:SNF2 family ATP-dependent chromatin-remodeling factor snf21 [Gaeumannomyces tritici R3-111a-1]EJT72593.1 SNF2 family ATP-dependent chromatin-remodeling factor snf21 [Gaeumannomyces tritici R3-111a-1]
MEDPWDFDSNRLVRELCTDNHSWTPPSKGTRPDPAALEEKILDLEADGEFLLRYAGTTVDVFADLGIKKFPHKRFLLAAIEQFRARSKKYRHEVKGESSPGRDEAVEPSVKATDAVNSSFPLGPEPLVPVSLIEARPEADDGPRKRRRLAPRNVEPTPRRDTPRAIPNQADTVIGFAPVAASTEVQTAASTAESQHDFQHSVSEHRYYASRPILSDDFEPDADPAGEDFGVLDPGHLEFSFTSGISASRPAGHRIAMSRSMRKYLQTNLRGAPLAGKKVQRARQATPDVVLRPYGESDSEGYDTDTWKEMEEERLEREQKTKQQETFTADEISGFLENLVSELEEEWRTEKLPKHQNKAHSVWNNARRRGSNRAHLLRLTKKEATELDARLSKICDSISDDQTFQKADLPKHRESLQPTVYARMHSHWLIGVLSSLTEPERPKVAPRPRPPKAPKVKLIEDGVEADELTSDSESDDIGDFVVDDGDVSMEGPAPEVIEKDGDAAMDSQDDANVDSGVTAPGDLDVDEDRKPLLSDLERQPAPSHGITLPVDESEVIDLTGDTPKKPRYPAPSSLPADSVPPIALPASTLNDPVGIAAYGLEHWQSLSDGKRMVITMLFNLDVDTRSDVFSRIKSLTPEKIENELVTPSFGHVQRPPLDSQSSQASVGSPELHAACVFTRLFLVYTDPSQKPDAQSWIKRVLGRVSAERVLKTRDRLGEFSNFMASIADTFPQPDKVLEDVDFSDLEVEGSPSKKRKQVKRDKGAMDMRENDKRRLEQQEERRHALRRQLASMGTVSGEKSRLIINETKEESHGLIYVTNQMADSIKDHQIQGVRFMWNQVIADEENSQGCLLAHTMGLGKTMQVICLLVAIAEASLSDDPSLFSQIPEELRESKTLVLCPSGLVQNWLDELARWAPMGILGKYYKVDAELPELEDRFGVVQEWAKNGGVLIVGYPMFRILSERGSEAEVELLKETPNIVVGDEAHHMKNSASKTSMHTARFKTKTRIAMTGSPLANSVKDYYAMVNWVAPNYLGPPEEFASVYATPIQEGLYQDSSSGEKRKALKLLKALKDTVAPKIHRMTMAALKDQLPPKKEFIIYVPLTKLQMDAYSMYMEYFSRTEVRENMPSILHLFDQVSQLSMLLAHPRVFLTRLKEIKDNWGKGTVSAKSRAAKDQGEKGSRGKGESMLPRDLVGELIKCLNVRDSGEFSLSHKMVVLLRILEEAKAQKDKVLLFSSSIPTLDFLESVMKTLRKPYSRLDGKTVISRRQGLVAKFNQNLDEVYLISTTAGGVGLNIQGANRIVIMDFKWSPVNEQQAIGRAYRIGQSKPVFVYWLIVGGTYEPKLHGKAIFKTQLASRVVDKKNPHSYANKYSSWTEQPKVMNRTSDFSNAMGHDKVLDAVLKSSADASICEVALGDLFEEEEPESTLSPEDLADAERMVKANQLRLADPEAYARMAQQQAAIVPPPPPEMLPMGLRAPQQAVAPGWAAPPSSVARPAQANGASSNGQPAPIETPVPLPSYITQQEKQKSKTPDAAVPNTTTPAANPIGQNTPLTVGVRRAQGNGPQGGPQLSKPAEAVPAQTQDPPSAVAAKPLSEAQGPTEPIAAAGTAFRAQGPSDLTQSETFLAEIKARAPAFVKKTDEKMVSNIARIFGYELKKRDRTGLPLISETRIIIDTLTRDEGVWTTLITKNPVDLARIASKSVSQLEEMVDKHLAERAGASSTSTDPGTSSSTPIHKNAAAAPRQPSRPQDSDRLQRFVSLNGGSTQGSPSSSETRQPTKSEQDLEVMNEVFRRRKAKTKSGRDRPARMPNWAVEGIQTPPQRRAGDDPQTPVVLDD